MPFDLEELLNRRKPSMKRPAAAAAVHRRPAAVVTLDSDSDKDIEVLLDAELEDKDPQPFPQLHLAWNIGCWFKWWMLCFFLNVSAIDFLSLVCFLHIIVYWGRPFRFPAISTGLGPWLSDGGGLVLLYLCIFVSSLTIITVEAMARNFVASQRRALWDGICQRQIMCSVWVRESFKCITLQMVSKHVWVDKRYQSCMWVLCCPQVSAPGKVLTFSEVRSASDKLGRWLAVQRTESGVWLLVETSVSMLLNLDFVFHYFCSGNILHQFLTDENMQRTHLW